MGKKTKMEGGFAYQNTGEMENCYAAVKIGGRNSESAGFVYDNRGEAQRCFARSMGKGYRRASEKRQGKRKDGFVSVNSGRIDDSFFLVKNRNHLKKYRDRRLGRTVKKADPGCLKEDFFWDFDVFEEKNASEMDFLVENWHSPAAGYVGEEREEIEIRTKGELLDFIDRVNRGEPGAVNAHCELITNLDFHGKTIPSIGCDRQHPFCGTFNGGGYKIKGFILQGKGMAETGFFGFLKGSVCNLSIDCVVKGGDCPLVAGFCAVNEGDIRCCEAVVEVKAKRYAGLFTGENNGLIERCCVSGKSKGAFLFWLWPCLPFLALILGILFHPPVPPEDYVPVMADASIIPNGSSERGERTNENKASYEVPKILKVDAATLTAKSEPYVIQNPDRGANYDFVAVLYMADSNGKDVEVYRSGRIPVGYHIEDLTLAPPDGTTLPAGIYDAKMVFSFYHHNTGEKGMVDSAAPLTIEIE